MLDVRKACYRYNELLEDGNISTATDAIESLMEEMEALKTSLAGAEGYASSAFSLRANSGEGGAPAASNLPADRFLTMGMLDLTDLKQNSILTRLGRPFSLS